MVRDDYANDLIRRADLAYQRECRREGLVYQQPSAWLSYVEENKGRLYVCLRNGNGLLKAYRVRENGRLEGLRQPPRITRRGA